MAQKLVTVRALKQAVTNVRTENGNVPVTTNPDKKGEDANIKVNPKAKSAYEFTLPSDQAEQLEKKGVAKILADRTEADDGEDLSPAAMGAKRLAENAKADSKPSKAPSGASTRDTTAFATNPLKRAPADVAGSADDGSAAADAPPGTAPLSDLDNKGVEELAKGTSDVAELEAMLAEEKEGKDRTGAKAAIESRIAELQS